MASPVNRHSSGAIPIRKVVIDDPANLPAHYSATPGGTLFSTTPGGTKIVYERNFLMNLRNSPISKTPPNCSIPDILQKGKYSTSPKNNNNKSCYARKPSLSNSNNKKENEDDQFQLDL